MNDTAELPAKTEKPSKPLPNWKVIVHDDNKNTIEGVIKCFMEILHLEVEEAYIKTMEVHTKKLSVVKVTHKEHAELIEDQLKSKTLTVTIEPDV